MPDIAKIGTVATGNISKIGTLTYSDENISHVLGVDMPADGEGGGGDDGGGGGATVSTGEYGNVQGAAGNKLFTGNQGTGQLEYSVDLSTSDYANGSLTNGNTGHVFLRYESGGSYRQDPQLYQIDFDDGGWVKVGQSSGGTWGYGQWKTTYRTTNQAYNHSSTWNTVNAGTSPTGRWHRDTSGTGSGGTGVSKDYHIYYEGSNNGYYKDVYLRSPEFTFTTNTIKLRMYGYGSNMGTMYLGIYVTA